MRPPADPPQSLAPWLWALLGVFVLRVTGQVLVAFYAVGFLPPMPQWYSGLLPYPVLLPAQLGIIALMLKICVDFTRGAGLFVVPHRFFARPWLTFGYGYLAVMVLRYPVQQVLMPGLRWFDGTIPIVAHWGLAAFVILVGRYHRSRLAA
jgi:hypothetical protein